MAVASGYADVAGEEIQVVYFCFAAIKPKSKLLKLSEMNVFQEIKLANKKIVKKLVQNLHSNHYINNQQATKGCHKNH